jgi:hypothetical protein
LPGRVARNLHAPEVAFEKRPFLRITLQRRARTLGRDLSPKGPLCECNVDAGADSFTADALEKRPCLSALAMHITIRPRTLAIGRRKPSGGILDVLIDSSKNHGLESRPREVHTRSAASDRPAQPKTTSSPSLQ